MTGGVIAWGSLADQYAPAAFHADAGMLISGPLAGAWLASTIVFAVSTVAAVMATRSAFQDA